MRIPDFIIIGAPKAGTTWLAQRLNEHPTVYMPKPFETHFYNIDENYAKGLDWYAGLFDSASEEQLVGEKTPNYLKSQNTLSENPSNTAARIFEANSTTKLIAVLRNPVQRALSAFHHHIRARRLSPWLSFDSVVADFLDHGKDPHSIFSDGYYAEQLETYMEYFPTNQLLVLIFEEEIAVSEDKALTRVAEFLHLCTEKFPKASRLGGHENRGLHTRIARIANYYAPSLYIGISLVDRLIPSRTSDELNPKLRKRLYSHYESHNKSLAKTIGRELPSWAY